jgi:hypothetical protein
MRHRFIKRSLPLPDDGRLNIELCDAGRTDQARSPRRASSL